MQSSEPQLSSLGHRPAEPRVHTAMLIAPDASGVPVQPAGSLSDIVLSRRLPTPTTTADHAVTGPGRPRSSWPNKPSAPAGCPATSTPLGRRAVVGPSASHDGTSE